MRSALESMLYRDGTLSVSIDLWNPGEMEQAMEDLTVKMRHTDSRLDDLALQMGHLEQDFFGGGDEVQVTDLLKSVNEVKTNYQSLRKDLGEVQDLQKQLSGSLQLQLRLMQTKFRTLKEKIEAAKPLEAPK